MVAQNGVDPLVDFKERLDRFVESFSHSGERGRERRIAYGNLRHEYSDWTDGGETSTNVAVIYETPGGSTVQINVTYESGKFTFLDPVSEERVTATDPGAPLQMIANEVRQIPDRRMERLRQQVEEWCNDGMCNRELFAELNKVLQSDFLGGAMTQRELRLGIKHAMSLRREA